MFYELKSLVTEMKLNFTPKMVMNDFELALVNFVKTEVSIYIFHKMRYLKLFILQFSQAERVSCYFHFTQAVYRAIQRFGLASTYNNNADIKYLCRKLMTLPLLPEPLIEDTYDELIENLSSAMRNEVNQLLSFFQEQWFVTVPTTQ